MTDDRGARNEYYRQWRQRNLEYAREYDRQRAKRPERKRKVRESGRRYREANPERERERHRQYGEANREQINAYTRQWKRDNRERKKVTDAAWRAANPERVQAMAQRARASRKTRRYIVPSRVRRRELTDQLWHEQAGKCYLCERLIERARAVLDHDHRCCPLDAYCSYCVRGAACNGCNQTAGILNDDPDLLELVARNLRAKLAEVDERLRSKPEQLPL